jgi:hypothetical protein
MADDSGIFHPSSSPLDLDGIPILANQDKLASPAVIQVICMNRRLCYR